MEKKDIDQLIEAMKPVFATKEDLGVFPTAEKMDIGFGIITADIARLQTEMNNQFREVKKAFTRMEARLPENSLTRLEQLEEDMKKVKEALSIS